MYTDSRNEEVKLLKRLWAAESTICPKCGMEELTHLHQKAKKSNNDWKCPICGEIYRTINMLYNIQDK